jgi:hypothetical protein
MPGIQVALETILAPDLWADLIRATTLLLSLV